MTRQATLTWLVRIADSPSPTVPPTHATCICVCCVGLLQVHAGFGEAWLHSGFNAKVLARLRELDQGPTPLRFWVTGHSLGGALAALAALCIRREHPDSQITCYTFGCPRVGRLSWVVGWC